MFRRKEEDGFGPSSATGNMPTGGSGSTQNSVTESATLIYPGSSAAARPAAATSEPAKPAPVAPTAPSFRSPAPTASAPRGQSEKLHSGATPTQGRSNRRVLTLGPEIAVKGEVSKCDRLVIEGNMDATVTDVDTIELNESGTFKGSAKVEYAEISGLFEGDLMVKNRLVIYSTGKVRGKITYGEIEIERGGELTGEIKTGGTNANAGSNNRPNTSSKAA
jgi:cytoskeletal protein CcmA (bactofilin family)